jgi:hypothetical protein
VWERTNILEIGTLDLTAPGCDEKLKPNFVTCFEVLEHVEPRMMIAMLEHVKSLATDDAEFYFSTPCWNRVDCADNHVNEMLYQSLGSLFERRGFDIVRVSGTFASIRDYQHLLRNTPWGDLNHLFDALRGHYDSNFLSCIFAPLFPANSRNCLWELRKHDPIDSAYTPKFPKIHEIERPWSSSALWTEMEL